MEYNKFKDIMLGMGAIFSKEYKDMELTLLYKFFKDYRQKDFRDAIEDCIRSLDKLPTVHQLEEKCEWHRCRNELEEAYKELPPITNEDRIEYQQLLESFK